MIQSLRNKLKDQGILSRHVIIHILTDWLLYRTSC